MQNDKTHLRKFGFVVGGVFAGIALWLLLRSAGTSATGIVLGALSLALILIGLAVPLALRPVEKFWMLLAHALGWINTRIILGTVFYTIFALTRFFLFVFRKDPMHRHPDPALATYWTDVRAGEFNPSSYEDPF